MTSMSLRSLTDMEMEHVGGGYGVAVTGGSVAISGGVYGGYPGWGYGGFYNPPGPAGGPGWGYGYWNPPGPAGGPGWGYGYAGGFGRFGHFGRSWW